MSHLKEYISQKMLEIFLILGEHLQLSLSYPMKMLSARTIPWLNADMRLLNLLRWLLSLSSNGLLKILTRWLDERMVPL